MTDEQAEKFQWITQRGFEISMMMSNPRFSDLGQVLADKLDLHIRETYPELSEASKAKEEATPVAPAAPMVPVSVVPTPEAKRK